MLEGLRKPQLSGERRLRSEVEGATEALVGEPRALASGVECLQKPQKRKHRVGYDGVVEQAPWAALACPVRGGWCVD